MRLGGIIIYFVGMGDKAYDGWGVGYLTLLKNLQNVWMVKLVLRIKSSRSLKLFVYKES